MLDIDGNTNTTSTPKFSSKSEDKEITSITEPIPQKITYAEEDIEHDNVNRGAEDLSKSIKHKHLKLDTHINILNELIPCSVSFLFYFFIR